MSFPPPLQTDLAISLAAIGTAVIAVGLFMRSTRFWKKKEEIPLPPPKEEETSPKQIDFVKLPTAGVSLNLADVERAKKTLDLLSLERDALSMAISKFFEAEDEGEITKEEREKLSKSYEERVKALSDKIRQTELVVGLYELEKIREEILKRFDAKLSETNAKIEELRKELKLEVPVEEEKKVPAKKEKEKAPAEEKEKEETEEKTKQRGKPRSELEERIEKLRQEVLKELEELEKLEIDI